MKILKWLDGQKTNLGCIAAGILGICYTQEWIDAETGKLLAALIFSWTGVSFRQALKKRPTK